MRFVARRSSKLQKQNVQILVTADKAIIPVCGSIPALILHKSMVDPQIHRHRRTANRAVRHQLRWNFHIFLLSYHLPNLRFIVIGLFVTGFGALPKAVIALCVKQPLFIKPCELKLMIHIGGNHEVIFIPHQCKQIHIRLTGGDIIAVYIDLP